MSVPQGRPYGESSAGNSWMARIVDSIDAATEYIDIVANEGKKIMSSVHPFLLRKARKRTEEDGIASPTRTRPPKNAADSANFRPRRFKGLSNANSMMTGENSESAALGVECVLRKVRDERQCAATRLARFRYALSNRTRGRFSRFSPTQQNAPERHLRASGEKRV